MRALYRRSLGIVAGLLCATLLHAGKPSHVTIEIGQPSIWSLGQAHYLLAKMHARDRKLSTRLPDESDLDSSRINATRIEALRSSLGMEAQYDQAIGLRNEMALGRFQDDNARRTAAGRDLRAAQSRLEELNQVVAALDERIAQLEEEDRQSAEERARQTPPASLSEEDRARRVELATSHARRATNEQERTELKALIAALKTTVDATPTSPALEEPALSAPAVGVPAPDSFKKFMEEAVNQAGKPDLSASIKLDNFVQMQYEIIAKQLTLLRDEVGPDDRIIFLELPASIYTVDRKADDLIAQVEWEVTKYYDKEPTPEIQASVMAETLRADGLTEEDVLDAMSRVRRMRESAVFRSLESKSPTKSTRPTQSAPPSATHTDTPYPITLEMIKRQIESETGAGSPASESIVARDDACAPANPAAAAANARRLKVRAIDIIPRQSALNVNAHHATVRQTGLIAAFKFLVGFAGKVDYQRQRELYEQFVQQQVFASGYGKGDSRFGWTYGPQPGTRRIAPGQRTTFAVLAVPRGTLALELTARGRYFNRRTSPTSHKAAASPEQEMKYLVAVPGVKTQEFWVDSISYTPVKKGQRLTAVIGGNYFSPQLGVLVNGVPLEPVLSISRRAGGDEETEVKAADGIAGEYEITNTRQMIMSFTMGDRYVGTPTLTLTSPEKSTPINFFGLEINHSGEPASLQSYSEREPMFIDDFNLQPEMDVVPLADACPVLGQGSYLGFARLRGTGLRPGATLSLNNAPLLEDKGVTPLRDICGKIQDAPRAPFFTQESTSSYLLYSAGLEAKKRRVVYRQPTRQGFEEREFKQDLAEPPLRITVRNYRFNPTTHAGELDLTLASTIPGASLEAVAMEDPLSGSCQPTHDGPRYRVKCTVPCVHPGMERDFITLKITVKSQNGQSEARFEDLRLPVRPVLISILNKRTNRPEGFSDEEPTVLIGGVNLQAVSGVLFGDKASSVVGTAASDALTVKVPKGPSIPAGQAVATPVTFQTAAGQVPTGAIYTYLGGPSSPAMTLCSFPCNAVTPAK